MPTKPKVDEDTLRAGRGLALLRERAGLTQVQAAEAVEGGMTPQYWQMHEAGRVPGIFKPSTQRKLIDALNAAARLEPALTIADLEQAAAGATAQPLSRSARIAAALAAPAQPDGAQAVFPTRDGNVVFSFPPGMTPEGYKDLEAYFAVFLRTRGAPD